jgi:peptidylprolyl isomerase
VVVAAIVVAYVLINTSHDSSTKKTAATASTTCAKVLPDPPATGEPTIPQVGAKPTSLVSKDLITGKGRAAKSGDKLVVKYVGVACSTGKAFDASYTDGSKNKELSFTLGKSQVITGWDKGLVGVKPGGRRELVIPPSLAYGANGSSGIKANETLEFVVDVVSVTKG